MSSFETPRPDSEAGAPDSYGDPVPPSDEADGEGPPPTYEEFKEEVEGPALEEADAADKAEAERIAKEEADRASGEEFPRPAGEE